MYSGEVIRSCCFTLAPILDYFCKRVYGLMRAKRCRLTSSVFGRALMILSVSSYMTDKLKPLWAYTKSMENMQVIDEEKSFDIIGSKVA